MEESQTKKIEEKLKRMIELQSQANKKKQEQKNLPPAGTKAIRRRKGAPDKHIM